MSLHQFERACLTLYTDAHVLEQFTSSPDVVLSRFELSAKEKDALTSIPRNSLITFNRQLNAKSHMVAEKLLIVRDSVVLVPFHPHGPVLKYKTLYGIRSKKLTPGMYETLHRLSRTKQPLTLQSIVREYPHSKQATMKDFFSLSYFMYACSLMNKEILVPLVL